MKLNRRDFLKTLGTVSAAIPMIKHSPKQFLKTISKRKILVVVELLGGNDGLNTVIPFTDSTYYSARPVVGINKSDMLQINDSFAFHPSLEKFKTLFDEQKLSVILGVGYPDYDLSHFRSTDIWRGASMESAINSGWTARYLEYKYSDYGTTPPSYPVFIEVKDFSTILGEGDNYSLGFTLENPKDLYETMNGLYQVYRTESQNTYGGDELNFVRDLIDSGTVYAEILNNAYSSTLNTVEYPQNNSLANDLATVARMIGSGLKTEIYSVSMGGFDTHVDQNETQPTLLREMSEAIYSFQKDLEGLNVADEVTIFVMSEFGRRVYDNGTGTDHGTASVSFLVGENIRSGFYGSQPSLNNLDESGNLKFTTDFREIYASILNQWFFMPYQQLNKVLYQQFSTLPLFKGCKLDII